MTTKLKYYIHIYYIRIYYILHYISPIIMSKMNISILDVLIMIAVCLLVYLLIKYFSSPMLSSNNNSLSAPVADPRPVEDLASVSNKQPVVNITNLSAPGTNASLSTAEFGNNNLNGVNNKNNYNISNNSSNNKSNNISNNNTYDIKNCNINTSTNHGVNNNNNKNKSKRNKLCGAANKKEHKLLDQDNVIDKQNYICNKECPCDGKTLGESLNDIRKQFMSPTESFYGNAAKTRGVSLESAFQLGDGKEHKCNVKPGDNSVINNVLNNQNNNKKNN